MRFPRRPSPCWIHSLPPGKKFTKVNRAMPAMAKTASEQNAGPKLSGDAASKSPEELSNLLRHPTAKMIEGEMKAVEVSDDDLKALVAYIKSLK